MADITSANKGDALRVTRLWCEENAIRHIDHTEYAIIAEALDNLGWAEIIGTIAGDNTIFIAAKSEAEPTTSQFTSSMRAVVPIAAMAV